MDLLDVTLSENNFTNICSIVYKICKINLRDGKQELVKSRLMKRLPKNWT